MSVIKRIIKYILFKLFTLRFLERLSQNIIWREILEKKKSKITASVNGALNAGSWDKVLRHTVWDKIPEYIDVNNDILYIEFGVWKGESINLFGNFLAQHKNEIHGFDSFEGLTEDWLTHVYNPVGALSLNKKTPKVFAIKPEGLDQTVKYVTGYLGIDPKDAEQNIRSTVSLPNGTGKEVKIAVFAGGEALTEAQEAGADIVGGKELATKVASEEKFF